MVYLLYDTVLLLSGLFLVPYYLFLGLRHGKRRRGIRERLGYYDPQQISRLREHPVIWVHAVSVGETRAAAPLIATLREQYPEYLIVVTNMTETGHATAKANKHIDLCLLAPFDLSWVVRRAFEIIQPKIILIVETEIWPQFIRCAHRSNIPLLMVNGRLSDRSFPRYRRFTFLVKPILQDFSLFCMQSQMDKERIIALGASQEQVDNTGNLKFDHNVIYLSEEEVCTLKERYRIPESMKVLVAGSTHQGEEQQLFEAYQQLQSQCDFPLLLVIIPRHPERRREVQETMAKMELVGRLRSELTIHSPMLSAGEVLIGDTLGEVIGFYSVADLVFVGGSLVPVGGHNLLEAALVSKPVVFGPYIHNFKEISTKLIAAGAGIKVDGREQLVRCCLTMLKDPSRRRMMGEAGRALIEENTGATDRIMTHIARFLKDRF